MTQARVDGVVAAGAAPAARCGAAMLERGGNAVDAAVAAALGMAVADPANASIAGRCHVLVVRPDLTAVALDGRTALPAAHAPDAGGAAPSGPRVVPVPGNPTTLAEAVARFGRLSWAEVVAPAQHLAATGITVPPCLGEAWRAAAPGLRSDCAAAALFLPGGSAPVPGSAFVQPRLAGTLEDLAVHGPAAMMSGPRAARMVRLLREQGSVLTEADFSGYRPLDGEVVRFAYRGWRGFTIGRQGYGYTLAETLGILSRFDLSAMVAGQRWVVAALAQALARRDRPRTEEEPAAHLLDGALLDARAAHLGALANDAAMLREWLGPPPPPPVARRGDTTHISALDGSGLACAITTSIGPHFGALVAAPDDGFLFAHSYRMAERDAAARRDRTEMLPTVLVGPAGEIVVLGAAGGSRIPGAVVRAIVGMVDLGQDVGAAVNAPAAVWQDGSLLANPALGADVLYALELAGLPLVVTPPRLGQHFGLLHAAASASDGALSAAADPYWDGVHVGTAGRAPAGHAGDA